MEIIVWSQREPFCRGFGDGDLTEALRTRGPLILGLALSVLTYELQCGIYGKPNLLLSRCNL